jgi:putative ABC transport system substrate-binding protein
MDVIVAAGPSVEAASQATTTIPIVAAASPRFARATSLARPGGNVTGLAIQSEELPGKWVELLKETSPQCLASPSSRILSTPRTN